MGLLDELQSEADRIRDREVSRGRELEDREAYYQQQLRPVMQLAREYCHRLVENLAIVQPDLRPSYPLNPLAPLGSGGIELRQVDYQFHYDDGRNPRQLDIHCQCTLEQAVEFHVPTVDAAQRYGELLDKRRFPFQRRDHRDNRHNVRSTTFILEGPMPVHIRLLAQAADRCVQVLLLNLEEQPLKRYQFAPQQLDNALLERLARVLVRRETQLVQTEVSEDFRAQLQARIASERQRNEVELARAYDELEARRQAEEEARLSNRARRALRAGVEAVSGRFIRRDSAPADGDETPGD